MSEIELMNNEALEFSLTDKEIRMKNIMFKYMAIALCTTSSSGLFAGNMGPITQSEAPSFIPFISGEGLYSWPKVQGITIILPPEAPNTGTSTNINQGWGGRVAAGLMHAITDRFAYSGEVGWGYYGHTEMPITFTSPLTQREINGGIQNTTGNLDRWGFDALLGLLYTQPKYDLYAKAGALFQNLRLSLYDITLNTEGGTISTNTTVPGVLPEIKLGAAYHITDKLSANVSWMYAFGGDFSVTLPYNDNNSVITVGAIGANLKNPSMNVVMFGLEYRFG